MKIFCALAAAALFAGCTSVLSTGDFKGVVHSPRPDSEPVALVEIENSGWFILECIPFASGDPRYPNRCKCRFFRDTVTLENNLKALEAEMKRAGADGVADLTSHWTDESALLILLTRRACHTSALLLRKKDGSNPAGAEPPENEKK